MPSGNKHACNRRVGGLQLYPGLLRSLILVLFLACGLCAAPYVASLHEFGHWHGEDEPEHVHEIDATLVNPILTTTTVAVNVTPSQNGQPPLPLGGTAPLEPSESANPIRAPPPS